jgi:hypothetical protein
VRPAIAEDGAGPALGVPFEDCTRFTGDGTGIALSKWAHDEREFLLDAVLPPSAGQADMYDVVARDVVRVRFRCFPLGVFFGRC